MTPQNVKQVIEAEDDFGHEMRVGNEIKKAAGAVPSGFFWPAEMVYLKHGHTYIDPITSKDRQFDFRCQIRFNDSPGNPNQYCVLLAIECKNLHNSSPLAVCGTDRTFDEAFHTFVESKAPNNILMSPTAKTVRGSRLYPQNSFVGKSLVRLKEDKGKLRTDPQGDLYDRWSQAIASAKEMAREATFFSFVNHCDRYCSFVLPIVVVPDGLLWSVTYNDTGKVRNEPTLVDRCEFFIGAKIELHPSNPRLALTHIHFATVKGFTELLKDLILSNPNIKRDEIFPINSQ